jgi:uncharacterized protein
MGEKLTIRNNEDLMRFETGEGDNTAYLEYLFRNNNEIVLLHTCVPNNMSGKGIALALAEHAFQYARKNKKLVRVHCSFVSGYVKQHPEVKKLLSKELLR